MSADSEAYPPPNEPAAFESLCQRDYDGADYFDWSFYSQGTREVGGASADVFVAKALKFFGDPAMAGSAASPWDKAATV